MKFYCLNGFSKKNTDITWTYQFQTRKIFLVFLFDIYLHPKIHQASLENSKNNQAKLEHMSDRLQKH